MGWESFDVVRFDLGGLPSRSNEDSQTKKCLYLGLLAELKMVITRLLLVLEVLDVEPTYRKSWAGNLLVWSDLTLDPSFKVKRGYPNLKVLISRLIIGPRGFGW